MSAVIASRRRAASMALLFLKRTAVSAIEPAGMACRTRFAVSGTRRRCWAGVLPQCQPRWSSVDHLDHHHHELPNRQTAKGLGYSCVSTACEAYGIRTGTSTGRPLGSSSYCTGTCRLSICSWLVRSLRRDRTNDLACASQIDQGAGAAGWLQGAGCPESVLPSLPANGRRGSAQQCGGARARS